MAEQSPGLISSFTTRRRLTRTHDFACDRLGTREVGPGLRPGNARQRQWKRSPQAQLPAALGLSMVKPCFWMVSSKSIVAPSRYGTLILSTMTSTPSKSTVCVAVEHPLVEVQLVDQAGASAGLDGDAQAQVVAALLLEQAPHLAGGGVGQSHFVRGQFCRFGCRGRADALVVALIGTSLSVTGRPVTCCYYSVVRRATVPSYVASPKMG